MAAVLTQLRALWLFYRGIAPFTIGLTALIIGTVLVPLLHEGKANGILTKLLLVKIFTGPVVWYLAERARPNQYWFYYNLGISRRRLWAGVAVLDGLLFVGAAVAVKSIFA